MTDTELLRRWAVDREIRGGGQELALAFERQVKDLEEQLAVAVSRTDAWKVLYVELAEALRGQGGKQ